MLECLGKGATLHQHKHAHTHICIHLNFDKVSVQRWILLPIRIILVLLGHRNDVAKSQHKIMFLLRFVTDVVCIFKKKIMIEMGVIKIMILAKLLIKYCIVIIESPQTTHNY